MQGMSLSIIFSFLVLLVATKNFFLSLFAMFTIGSVIATTMGAIQVHGWKLSLPETMCLIIFIGFSVDYIVHMAH